MSTTSINIRVDTELKKAAESLFEDLGLSMSSAITMFLRSAVRCDGIPFSLKRRDQNFDTKVALTEYEEMKNNSKK